MTPPRSRICLIAPEFIGPFPNGGVGTACYWEAATLAAAGYDVTVLYTGPTDRENPEHWERIYSAGPFTYVDLWRLAATGALGDARAESQPCAEAHTGDLVLRFLRERSFDLLLFQEFMGHGARALQARRSGDALAGVPAAVTLHSCRQWIYDGMKRLPATPQDLHVDFLERESARLADYVIAPSQHMADWAQTHWRLPEPTAVIPYCYDAGIESPAARIRHDGPFTQLVFFGRLETRKGLHIFCRAIADEAARGPVKRITFLGKSSTVEGRPSDEFIRAALGGLPGVDIRIIGNLGSLEALDWLTGQRDAIVVAPSLVDNLPYAVIELFARRLPMIASTAGGVPEIVGAANRHLLAEPTPQDLAATLARVHRDGHLTIDYRHGYSIGAANAAHVEHVSRMIAEFRPPVRSIHRSGRRTPDPCQIVVVDAEANGVTEVRDRFAAADPTAARATFGSWSGWRDALDGRESIFVSREVTPRSGMVARLLRALGDSRVDAATANYECTGAGGAAGVAPLGGSLEAGWTRNLFGGPCFAAKSAAFDVIRSACASEFSFWPAYAAIACAGLELAVVPEAQFSVPSHIQSPDDVEAVARQYREYAPEQLDLEWLVKYASHLERARSGAPFSDPAASAGRALYDRLIAIPDAQIERYAGLVWTAAEDPFIDELRRLRTRLAAIAERWRATDPRAFMYGAGQHARLVLALEPELGRFIAGFVDRRPISSFLGKPCIRPEDVTPGIADAILYSSREFEREMHARLAHLPVDHVLLYGDGARLRPDNASSRMRRRFGHAEADVPGLHALQTRRPSWVEGGISGGDAEFLLELVNGVRPRSVLELGVASGASSAALLFALDGLDADSGDRVLLSCDVRPTCYFDAARATGSAVEEMYPLHRTRWVLDTSTDARRIIAAQAAGSIDLTFIDANHSHPWPLLDLLHLSRLAPPGSWVALHDIELPKLSPQYQVHGPQWLFEAWPFNKVHGVGESVNIGAVQLPLDLKELVPMALELLDRPWEHTPTSWHVELPEIFAEITRALAPRLPDPAQAA